jgi:hypothetical protein
MPINRDISDLPAAPRQGGSPPLRDGTLLAHQLADAWWQDYQEGPDFTRDRAMPELPLRASSMGTRCDRALWYSLTDTPQSNPPGAASVWRMRMGTLIHKEVDRTIAPNVYAECPVHGLGHNCMVVDISDGPCYDCDQEGECDTCHLKHGWWAEDVVDLRPAGYPGSAHGDLILYEHGIPVAVGETKSIGGFAFKICASNFKGVPEGPRWEHVLQAAIVAVALKIPKIVALYISPEPVSPDVAKSSGLDEYGKFIAEWHFATADWVEAVEFEVQRQKHVLDLATPDADGVAWMPTRAIHHPNIASGAIFDNPATGHWVKIDPVRGTVAKAGKWWPCSYCAHRDTCLADGEDMQQVSITRKA